MLDWPKDLYCDVRLEDLKRTHIEERPQGRLEDAHRERRAAFLRAFDGTRWAYRATTRVDDLQSELDQLVQTLRPNPAVANSALVRTLEVHQGEHRFFEGRSLDQVSHSQKQALVESSLESLVDFPDLKSFSVAYYDEREEKHFASSLGADLAWDNQRVGLILSAQFERQGRQHRDRLYAAGESLADGVRTPEEILAWLETSREFLEAETVHSGTETVIFSPSTAGVFAHECFGHKSEADFMLGDELALKEWSLGTKIASDKVSIVVDGATRSSGFTPFDDEGQAGRVVPLIEDGILRGRLHTSWTAAALGEAVTGNGRATNYLYEPIPRQTNTYFLAGNESKEELFSKVSSGVFVESFRHGSGMSRFTIAPCRAYRIRAGKIAEPLKVAVVSGQVFEALANVDGASDQVEIFNMFGPGGCGKMEQMGLPVAAGGPYLRVQGMEVQG